MKFTKVKIHPSVYTLSYPKTRNSELCGTTQHTRRKITIYPHDCPQQERDTLLHECLHALCHEIQFFKSDEEEENFILRFTPRLLAFIQDNPKIARYLINEKETNKDPQ